MPPRLIEVAFPLKQASLDSVHEKNVRHGHISTLYIWPARRPLAASRAALIAMLLADPGNPKQRQEVLERLARRVVETTERKRVNGRMVEKMKEETVGGIQQAPRRQKGQRPEPTHVRLGVPTRSAAHGRRFRRRSRTHPRRPRSRDRPRRRNHVLPAPSPRFRHRRGPHWRLHPLRPVVQPLGHSPRQPARPPRPVIEFGGETTPDPAVVKKINARLAEVSDNLKLN